MRFYLLLAFFIPQILSAHGVESTPLDGGRGLQFRYANGDPLSFADVLLFRPDEQEVEYQGGMTDENGVFMFLPDTLGDWRIKVSDGLGHGKVVVIKITDLDGPGEMTQNLPTWQRLVAGLGYLLFAYVIWAWTTTRKKTAHAHS